MAVVNDLIHIEGDGTISFGDYTLDTKTKLDNVEYNGDIYKVKTFKEITSLRGTECLFMSLFREQLLIIFL